MATIVINPWFVVATPTSHSYLGQVDQVSTTQRKHSDAYGEGIDKEWQEPPRWGPREVSFSLWDTPTKTSDIPCSNISSPRDRIAQRYAYLYKQKRKASRHYSQRAKHQSGERLRTATSSVTRKYALFNKKQCLFHIQARRLSSFSLSYQGRAGLCLSLFRPQPTI